ncbi:hypothetical protein FHG08_14225 [Pseudoalteromonas sp. Scap03]|uniref:hypothetical protein n=1 Tax=unclassified Pseudoalteromonas TaxID=194690 RepID=UPI0015B82DE2|nr:MULTISPECIES: hypothetical protein [unclassified Pseudoalteromonas]NWL16810.1 hypothetical protein [Pseudoalteromonas sp. Scap03]QLE81914.1 hypothetical protein FLM54_10455 [Pseudoalteromonas sp. Scap25]QLE89858.1 hypothetical protein FLM47_10470 [Pseudoalteromonas sp. Scap06]
MKKLINLVLVSAIATMPVAQSVAKTISTEGQLTLSYSDGRVPTRGVEKVNKVLKTVGVRVSRVPLPEEAKPILEISKKRAITKKETEKLISLFSMHRGDLLDQIKKAGRVPEVHRGGFLSTSEVGVAPYPKVYDMKAMTPEVMHYLQEKFGKLHVNSSDNGQGIDEVMTIVSGGEWTWFFALANNVVGKLTLGYVSTDGDAWRISYPGLGPHGGFLDAPYGLVVAYAHGPKNFEMRYEEPSVQGTETLGTNPWIDLSGDVPKLVD